MVKARNWMAATAVMLGFATAAAAAPVFFADRASFEAATSGLAFESFETSFSGDTTFASGLTASTAGSGTISDSTLFPTDGVQTLRFDNCCTPDPAVDALTFSFGGTINAFAVDIRAFGDVDEAVLTVTSDTGAIDEVLGMVPPLLPGDSSIFFGVIDTAGFASLSFLDTSVSDSVYYDAAAFGTTPIPVPASLPLLLAGVAGLGLLRRRKKG